MQQTCLTAGKDGVGCWSLHDDGETARLQEQDQTNRAQSGANTHHSHRVTAFSSKQKTKKNRRSDRALLVTSTLSQKKKKKKKRKKKVGSVRQMYKAPPERCHTLIYSQSLLIPHRFQADRCRQLSSIISIAASPAILDLVASPWRFDLVAHTHKDLPTGSSIIRVQSSAIVIVAACRGLADLVPCRPRRIRHKRSSSASISCSSTLVLSLRGLARFCSNVVG